MRPRLFQLIDLDRTLFNTAAFVECITEKINDWEPGLGDEIEARFEAAYKREETFFALDFIRERFGEARYLAMIHEVTTPYSSDHWYMPGAKERLEAANTFTSLRPSYGILTYAQNPEDQYIKLRLLGLEDVAVFIVDTPDKAMLLRSWQNADGTFRLPEVFGGGNADIITLEDDKLRAFTHMPTNMFGFWIKNGSGSQDGETLSHDLYNSVQAVQDLLESVSCIRELSAKL